MRPTAVPFLPISVARSYVAVAAGVFLFDLLRQTSDHLTNGAGRPFGDDFINYWSGAFLAWHGRAAEVYDLIGFHAFEQSVVGPQLDFYVYSYPPVLLLLTAPFAVVPYVPALVLWLVAGWFGFYRALRLAMPDRGALLLAVATPAVFVNAVGGQNGTWTAVLFGAGLGLLERRPVLAGGLLGLLIYKPHLGILVPVALLAGRHWRALAAAATVAGSLIVVSAVCFGLDVWADYIRNADMLRQTILENGAGVFHRMVSVFVAARRLGASVETAYLIQGVVGALTCFAVALVWFRNSPAPARNAVLVLGTCLTTPYLQDYDLVFGALVVAWLWQAQAASYRNERPLHIAAGSLLLIPVLAAPLANLTGLAFGPLFILPAFVIALQSCLAPHQDHNAMACPVERRW